MKSEKHPFGFPKNKPCIIEREIRLPVANVTCMGFGGVDLDELYITTAWSELSDQERKKQPLAGDLFRIKTNVKGVPESEFLG